MWAEGKITKFIIIFLIIVTNTNILFFDQRLYIIQTKMAESFSHRDFYIDSTSLRNDDYHIKTPKDVWKVRNNICMILKDYVDNFLKWSNKVYNQHVIMTFIDIFDNVIECISQSFSTGMLSSSQCIRLDCN